MIAARNSITAAAKTAMVWRGLLLVVGGAGLSIRDEPMRRVGLRVVVSLMAAGEAFAAFMQVFRARRLSAVTGRPYDAAYHGMVQDFGFYNLAMGLMLGLCAANPERGGVVLPAAIVLYAVHGGTHLLRYFGLYCGGEVSVPTRPRYFELRDALPLLAGLAGIVIFYPSLIR